MKRDIKETLILIFEYIGADTKYADYAKLQTYLEELIERNKYIK